MPADISVDVSSKSVVRDKDVLGKESDVFRRERWLEADSSKQVFLEGSAGGSALEKDWC
jgi:hypothetical protein